MTHKSRQARDPKCVPPARWSLDARFPEFLFTQNAAESAYAVTVNGLRYAIPTLSKRLAYIPEQFVGCPLLQAIATMWRLRHGEQPLEESELYWRGEIAGKRVWLRRKVQCASDPEGLWALASADDIIRKGDCVMLVMHHHERVVPSRQPIKLAETDELVVVDKPSGLPCSNDLVDVNSVRTVVCEELGLSGLRLAHRLDACVSGCLLMARTKKIVERCLQEMQSGRARKVYIARVEGTLPSAFASQGCEDTWVPGTESLECEDLVGELYRPAVIVDEPLSYDGHAERAVVDPAGSPSRTEFTWLATLSDGTHLLHCRLTSGRKHQIRGHLAFLGLPIANDELYGGTRTDCSGEDSGASLFTDDEAGTLQSVLGPGADAYMEWCPKCQKAAAILSGECEAPRVGATEIWLRSWRYSLPAMGVDVAAPLPTWAFDT